MSNLEAIRSDYRVQSVEDGFDWPEIICDLEKIHGNMTAKALYLVVFESEREPDADPETIATLDQAAHDEARQSSALLHYYADIPDENGIALSWCLWTDDQAARDAINGPAHREAMSRTHEFYGDNYIVKLYSVVPADEEIIFVSHTHPSSKNSSNREKNYVNL